VFPWLPRSSDALATLLFAPALGHFWELIPEGLVLAKKSILSDIIEVEKVIRKSRFKAIV
jgi:hypothetical protein